MFLQQMPPYILQHTQTFNNPIKRLFMNSQNVKSINNLFDDYRIVPARFLTFSSLVYNALVQSNTDGKYDDAISKVGIVIKDVQTEVNGVSSELTTQVNSTSDVNQVIYNFGQFMKNNSGAIAYALGGNTTAAYYQFYPYKVKEYLRAGKKTMPMLASRVADLASQYSNTLGANLASDLQGYLPAYMKLLSVQRQQIATVKQNRSLRTDAFAQGQLTLTGVVHDVANLNVGNPQVLANLFPFTVLYPPKKDKSLKIDGELLASAHAMLQNRTLTHDILVTVQNTCVNADVILWLAAAPTDEVSASPITVKANSTATVYAGDLGDLKNPFLMIGNNSNINKASYAVSIKGLKKAPVTKKKKVTDKGAAFSIAS